MKDALENSAGCINYALNLAKSNQKASIRKILKDLNHCRNFMNLSSKSSEIENVDLEMQNADCAQSTQNAQNLHNENTTHDMKKIKSFNLEMCIEKIIDKKINRLRSHLNKKLGFQSKRMRENDRQKKKKKNQTQKKKKNKKKKN